MKRIYLHIMVSAMAALTLAACDKEDAEPKAVRDYPIFRATIEGSESRAFDTEWEVNDQIGITGGGKTNVRYDTNNGDGLFEVYNPTDQIVFTDNDTVKFIAYYPYYSNLKAADNGIISHSRTSTSGNPTKLTTTTQTKQKDFDFLWATASGSKRSPNVEFKFAHVMSKISFVFKNGKDMDVSEIASYTLNGFAVTGQFDTNTGICSTTTTSNSSMKVTVSDVVAGEPVTPCIVFPQTLKEIPVQFNVTGSGTNYVYLSCKLPFKDTKIEAGKEYRFVITVNKTGLVVNESKINDWVTKDLGDNWEAS